MKPKIHRSVSDPLTMTRLGQSVMLTDLVLGQPQLGVFPSRLILPRKTVADINYKYPVWGKGHLRRYDTRRGLSAQIMRAKQTVSYLTGTLQRHTLAADCDVAELSFNSQGIPAAVWRESKTTLAKQLVDLDIESIAATLLTTSTNYPVSHRTALGSGSEWDNGGDVREDVLAMANAISVDSAGLIRPQDVSLYLPTASLEAALSDSAFTAASVYSSTARPGVDRLRDYLGIKEIITGSPVVVDDTETTTSSMYGDVAILFVNNDVNRGLNTQYGQLNFGATFAPNNGIALNSWYDDDHSTWVFPWEDWVEHKITNNAMGAIITNCSSIV